jgi:hypothetical protein
MSAGKPTEAPFLRGLCYLIIKYEESFFYYVTDNVT